MRIHRKEVKLKVVVRLGYLYTISTKKRGFGLQGTVNCGEVTRKSMRELMRDTVILVKSVYANLSQC